MNGDVEVGSGAIKATSNRKWKIIFFVIMAVAVVVSAVVAAVLIINNNNTSAPENTPPVEYTNGKIDDEAMNVYQAAISEIDDKIIKDDETGDDSTGVGVIDLYIEKIKSTKNTIAKAMLLLDYYQALMVYRPSLDLKDTVLNGLVGVDKILETGNSAQAVASAAEYYGDKEMAERYTQIADERMAAGNYGFHGADEGLEGDEEAQE